MIPSRWRVKSRSADEPDTGGITHRIEGTEALLWLTSDMNMYVTIVKDTMAATLPKMAVSVLLQRIIANDMLRRLQKMAMGVCTSQLSSAACCMFHFQLRCGGELVISLSEHHRHSLAEHGIGSAICAMGQCMQQKETPPLYGLCIHLCFLLVRLEL